MLFEIVEGLQNGNGKMDCLEKVQEIVDLFFIPENGRIRREAEKIQIILSNRTVRKEGVGLIGVSLYFLLLETDPIPI